MPLFEILENAPIKWTGFFTKGSFWEDLKNFFIDQWNEILMFLNDYGINLLISVIIILLLLFVTAIIARF
ncbi:MAG: hypothetical protein DRO63_06030, partial [Candidatus Gerdarchaeota archaeon]